MWVSFKCTVCGCEYANSDIEENEIPVNAETDENGNYLTICPDCQ